MKYFYSFCRVKTSNLKTAVTTGPTETEKYYDIPLKLQSYEKSTDADYELPTSTSPGEYEIPLESPQISSNPAYGVGLSKSTNGKEQLHVSSNPAYGVTLSKSNDGEQQPHVSSNPAYGSNLSTYKFATEKNDVEQAQMDSNPSYGLTTRSRY